MSHQIKDISEGTNLTFYIVRRRQKTKNNLVPKQPVRYLLLQLYGCTHNFTMISSMQDKTVWNHPVPEFFFFFF